VNSAPLAAAPTGGRSLSGFIHSFVLGSLFIPVFAALLVPGAGRASIYASTNFMTGRDAVNFVDAAQGSSVIPRTMVNTQAVGFDFPWSGGPLAFGMFYGRTSFDSGFGGPITAQSMGISCERSVIGKASIGIRSGDGIVNGPFMHNVSVVLFEFFTRIPLLGFPGVFLELNHQILVAEKGSTANNVYHANHVGVSIGGGSK